MAPSLDHNVDYIRAEDGRLPEKLQLNKSFAKHLCFCVRHGVTQKRLDLLCSIEFGLRHN